MAAQNGGLGSVAIRATDVDRDATISVLNDALAVGQLTPEEHSDRVGAALVAKTLDELAQLIVDVKPPRTSARSLRVGWRWGATVLALLLVALAIVAVGHTVNAPKQSAPAANISTSTVPVSPSSAAKVVASPTSAPVNGIEAQVVPPGSFGSHDPADECGSFGAEYQGGGNNCYLVIRFINSGKSNATFTPVDLHMVDQSGDEYMLEPVAPACYDSLDVNAPQTLQPGNSVDVQLCFPVMTGALPQTMKGTRSLVGLTLAVPGNSIDGTWGGL